MTRLFPSQLAERKQVHDAEMAELSKLVSASHNLHLWFTVATQIVPYHFFLSFSPVSIFFVFSCLSSVSSCVVLLRTFLYSFARWPTPEWPALCTSSSLDIGWWCVAAWRLAQRSLECVAMSTGRGMQVTLLKKNDSKQPVYLENSGFRSIIMLNVSGIKI